MINLAQEIIVSTQPVEHGASLFQFLAKIGKEFSLCEVVIAVCLFPNAGTIGFWPAFDPPLDPEVCALALPVNHTRLFLDNWIHVHEPSVKLGRIQNFNNWSRDMVPNTTTTCLGPGYFMLCGRRSLECR